ncbi:MAG TPA: protein kinase [Polyangiales bacterium]
MSRAPTLSPPRAEPQSSSWGGPAANEAAAEPMLGSYRLLALLAEGEHCSVHRARSCVAPESDVVVKRLRAPQDRGSRARLLREARIGLGVRDPHLVRVLALHDEPELHVVTQLIEGITLEQLLRAKLGVDALRFLLPMLIDVLHGLSALHQWRNEEGAPSYLVHQAVRARHILAGGDGVTRLIDLGDVHGSSVAGAVPVLPRQDGVDTYAPEQFDASQGLDPRCDVFLTGAVLHDVLTRVGVAPSSSLATLYAVAERARAPKRSARFWSAEEMAFTLQNAAVEAGVFASRPAVGAWVQAVRAGVPTDSSRSSGVRLHMDAGLAPGGAAPDRDPDDDELAFDVRTTAWERPLDRAALPPDLQVLLEQDAPLPPPRTVAAHKPALTARPQPPRAAQAPTPSLLLRETASSWPRWVAALALAGVGFGLAALLGVRSGHGRALPPPQAQAVAATPASSLAAVTPSQAVAPAPIEPSVSPLAPRAAAPVAAPRASGRNRGADEPAAPTRPARPELPHNPY